MGEMSSMTSKSNLAQRHPAEQGNRDLESEKIAERSSSRPWIGQITPASPLQSPPRGVWGVEGSSLGSPEVWQL